MKRHFFLLLFTLVQMPLAHAEFVVIVKADSQVQALTKDEVERIFLKKLKVFPNGDEAIPVGQLSRPETEEQFYKMISGKSKIELKAYWARLMFTGRDRPPKDGKDNDGVKTLVVGDKRAIGFIDATSLDASVKVVYRLR